MATVVFQIGLAHSFLPPDQRARLFSNCCYSFWITAREPPGLGGYSWSVAHSPDFVWFIYARFFNGLFRKKTGTPVYKKAIPRQRNAPFTASPITQSFLCRSFRFLYRVQVLRLVFVLRF
jgi:hypothetical protein